MRVFISGPITGHDDYKNAFEDAKRKIQDGGHEVINPADLDQIMPSTTTQDEYMLLCFNLISMSDAIYQLPGWEDSRGACKEYGFALGRGKQVFGQKDFSGVLYGRV